MCDERLRLLAASSQGGGGGEEKKLASLAKPAEVGVMLLLLFVSVCHRFESV